MKRYLKQGEVGELLQTQSTNPSYAIQTTSKYVKWSYSTSRAFAFGLRLEKNEVGRG